MESEFAGALRNLVIPPGVLTWLQEAVAESDITERAARERELKRLEEQHRRVDSKLEAMYEDRLEGRISPEMYDRKAKELRAQAGELSRRMTDLHATAPAPVQGAINFLGVASRAAELFQSQPPHEKQGFLKLVLKSAQWQGGRLEVQFEDPFQALARSNQLSQTEHSEKGRQVAEIESWLLR